jgi:hypothetical protein
MGKAIQNKTSKIDVLLPAVLFFSAIIILIAGMRIVEWGIPIEEDGRLSDVFVRYLNDWRVVLFAFVALLSCGATITAVWAAFVANRPRKLLNIAVAIFAALLTAAAAWGAVYDYHWGEGLELQRPTIQQQSRT